MVFLRNFIIVILLLVLAAISVVGIMVEAPQVLNYTPDRINALGRSVLAIMRPGHLLFYTWLGIFLACVLVLLITVGRPRRRMKIEVQMGGGRVVIMDAAIKKYIRNALAELNEVTVKKIDLREQRGLVTTDIYADVRTRENLPVLERRVIGRVRSALAEDLGITNLGDVHVYIRNFEVTGRPITPAPAPAKQPESAESSDEAEVDTENMLTRTEPAETGAPANEGTPRSSAFDEEPLAEPSPASPAAAVSATPGVMSAGALAEPIEPPGSTSPIIISDTDEDTRPSSDASMAKPETVEGAVADAETSGFPGTVTLPAEETGSRNQDDLDEPLPWGVYKKPDVDDRDKKDDKDQPAL